MSVVIEKGCKVTLHFSLKLDDGSVVDSTPPQQPATLVVGDGNLPEGFEQTLLGLVSGGHAHCLGAAGKSFWHAQPQQCTASA